MRHNSLVFKFSQYVISGNLLQLIKSFLKNRKQRVVLKGQAPSGINILTSGFPERSILGPPLS